MVTSIRQNSNPPGGPTAAQSVPPTMTPQDIQALVEEITQGAVVRFREQSSPMSVYLDDMPMALGDQKSIRIASVGLGYRTVTEHVAIFFVSNSTAGSLTLPLSPVFPFNCITDTSIEINGGAKVYGAPGYEGLMVALRNKRGALVNANLGSVVTGLADSLVRITAAAGLTLTAAAANNIFLCGYSGVAVAATTTNAALTVTWYTFEKLAFSRDSLLGALPLQNNSTYATLTRSFVGSLNPASGTQNTLPFGTPPTNVTVTLNSYKARTTYRFWSVPQDMGLYNAMIGNSYQVLTSKSNTFAATGPAALTYNVPQNNYLTAAHIVAWDGNSVFINPFTFFAQLKIQYNAASVTPIVESLGRYVAEQFIDTGTNTGDMPGYLLWDGNRTTEDLNDTDNAGWLDAYSAASPQITVDINGGLVVPATYNVVRECVVSGAVQVVGG